jgi:hypothetical protein
MSPLPVDRALESGTTMSALPVHRAGRGAGR